MRTLLIIDSNEKDLKITSALLADTYTISCCTSARDAIILLRASKFDYILLDIAHDPITPSSKTITTIRDISRDSPIICTGNKIHSSQIVSAIKHGARNFLEKPYEAVRLKTMILSVSSETIGSESLPGDLYADGFTPSTHSNEPQARYADKPPDETMVLIGQSKTMRAVRDSIKLFAKHNFPVLILGESGTGKELAASEIHRQSGRCKKRFVPVDCASIPEHLAESYLFGTEPGAFTGAVRRKGVFEESEGGTLFLDELGELNLGIQAKLLRVLETKKGNRMGSNQETLYDVRLVSATNSPKLRDTSKFRGDLLKRIDTLTLEMPPLRAQMEDIPELARAFLAQYDRFKILTGQAIRKLYDWHWPGNVRELKNVIQRAVVFSDTRKLILDTDIQPDTSPRWGSRQQDLYL